jgi:hypothetical protein
MVHIEENVSTGLPGAFATLTTVEVCKKVKLTLGNVNA